MTGNIQYYDLDYEAQIKIVNYNGTLTCKNENKQNGIIEVTDADSVVLYITAATSYQLQENVFLRPNTAKFKGNVHPHSLITNRIKEAVGKGYEFLRKEHIVDYQYFFNRVDLQLTDRIPAIPTDKLLSQYRSGKHDTYLEELFFQYGPDIYSSLRHETGLFQPICKEYGHSTTSPHGPVVIGII